MKCKYISNYCWFSSNNKLFFLSDFYSLYLYIFLFRKIRFIRINKSYISIPLSVKPIQVKWKKILTLFLARLCPTLLWQEMRHSQKLGGGGGWAILGFGLFMSCAMFNLEVPKFIPNPKLSWSGVSGRRAEEDLWWCGRDLQDENRYIKINK